MKILFRAYFHPKEFRKKVGRKCLMIRIRIRNRIRTFSKVGSGSGQKSSGSATLLVTIIQQACFPVLLLIVFRYKLLLWFYVHIKGRECLMMNWRKSFTWMIVNIRFFLHCPKICGQFPAITWKIRGISGNRMKLFTLKKKILTKNSYFHVLLNSVTDFWVSTTMSRNNAVHCAVFRSVSIPEDVENLVTLSL
jgi:hypothetical protein